MGRVCKRDAETALRLGLIIEPILSEGGDLHASPSFFASLQRLCGERREDGGAGPERMPLHGCDCEKVSSTPRLSWMRCRLA